MLEVLGRASSIIVRKVLWTCDELDLEREHIEWGAGALSLASPEFLALNPHGLVPVVRDVDLTLSESNTICRYLAAKWTKRWLRVAHSSPGLRSRWQMWWWGCPPTVGTQRPWSGQPWPQWRRTTSACRSVRHSWPMEETASRDHGSRKLLVSASLAPWVASCAKGL
jgi:glutathione S-transferase